MATIEAGSTWKHRLDHRRGTVQVTLVAPLSADYRDGNAVNTAPRRVAKAGTPIVMVKGDSGDWWDTTEAFVSEWEPASA